MDGSSRRIAAEILARIDAGELRPGDRIPSVRAIVRDRGVAHATASRALDLLRREGAVVTRPRSGSVVARRTVSVGPAGVPGAVAAARPIPAAGSIAAPGSIASGSIAAPGSAAVFGSAAVPGSAMPTGSSAPGSSAPGGPSGRGGGPRGPAARPGRSGGWEVVARAVVLADHGGLAAVSVRALAAELGMPTMSLHRLVGGKDELVRAMIDAAFGAFPPPAGAPAGWRAGLEATARRQWEAYRRHPWLAGVVSMTRPQAIDGLLAHADHAARALETTDLDGHARLELHLILFGYVRGMATSLAGEAVAQSDTGVDADTWAAQADPLGPVLAAGRFPALARMAGAQADAYPFDLDRLFEVGLRHTLDGFAVQIRAARRRARR